MESRRTEDEDYKVPQWIGPHNPKNPLIKSLKDITITSIVLRDQSSKCNADKIQ